MARREYGAGSIYQRHEARYGCPDLIPGPPHPKTGKPTKVRPEHKCKARWYGVVEAGWTASGSRDRETVSGKTKSEALRKLRDRRKQIDSGETSTSPRITVKQWVDQYLELRKQPPKPLSPNAWNAAASPLRKWVVPTIGHKHLAKLTPADLRAVAQAQYDAGRKTSTADATQRAFMTALNRAVKEGLVIPQQVLKADRPGMGESDRLDLPLEDALACLAVAQELPHGIRWALTLLYGTRQGEMLGLVEVDPITGERCIDFDEGVIRLAWQLQALKYKEKGRPEKGFEVPRDYVAVHLHGAYHLVRPKSKAGIRVLPMLPPVEDALRAWLAVRPENPRGLVFPTAKGLPCNDKVDREEWWAIQCTAGVGHPGGRWWHIHECRNLAATQLDGVGASDNVITSLLGHATILTSRGYMTAHLDAKRDAVAKVAALLGLMPAELP